MMPVRTLTSAIALMALSSTLIASAQSAQTDEDEVTRQQAVTVWGTAVSADSLYLGEGEIALKQADHLSDLLRTIPGVDIGGTHSVNSRINIRGMDDRNLSVYIDGALQTNYLYHHIGNLLVNPDILGSADVQMGSNSVTFGGIGGAVRFETKDASDLLTDGRNFGGRLMASYNDNAQTGFSGTAYAQFNDTVDGLVYFNRVDRDNFEDGAGRETIGSDGTTDNILAKAGFNITENQRLEISYDKLEDAGDYTQRPDMGVLTNQAITGDALLPTEYTRETINVGYGLDLGDAFLLEANYYLNEMDLWRDETNPSIPRPPGVVGNIKEAIADNSGLNVLAQSKVDLAGFEHTFKYGFEAFNQELAYVADVVAGTAPVNQEAKDVGIFIEDEINFSDRVYIRPGLRYNDYEVDYVETGESGSWNEFTFGIGGEAVMFDGFSIVGSYNQIFKGPELAEPFGGRTQTVKIVNPDLRPQTGDNQEIGLRFARHIEGADVTAGVNIFRTTIEDFIAEATIGTQAQDTNIGSAEINGMEVSLGWGWNAFGLFGTYASSDLDVSNLDLSSVSSESLREIGDQLGLELSYDFADWNTVANWSIQSTQNKESASGEVKQGYTVHNVSVRADDLGGIAGLSITAGVDNVFDEAYTSHASRTGATFHPRFGALELYDVEPGRNMKLTLAKVF